MTAYIDPRQVDCPFEVNYHVPLRIHRVGRLAGVEGRRRPGETFDKLAEYLLQYGDQVLRNLDDFDDDDRPDVIELMQKQGLIEEDGEGKFRVAPKGLRRIQEGALANLFQTFQRDGVGKHETPQKGGGAVRHEDSKPYVYGDSLANLNLHETLKNAMARQGGGTPIRLRQDDYVVYETEYQIELRHRRPDRHERLDGPLRQVRHDQEGRDGLAGDGPRRSTRRTPCRWSASTPSPTS